MTVRIEKSTAKGSVAAPPSKSFAHRLIIGASIAGGSTVHGVSKSEDMLATLDCAAALFGTEYKREGDDIKFLFSDLKGEAKGDLLCRESGSTIRFFIPLCLLKDSECTLRGSERLLSRPLDVYENICKDQGLTFIREKDSIKVKGPVKSGRFTVPGDVSSQFISGLLFALPLLDGDSVIDIIPPVESKPYIDITLEALALFGVFAKWTDEKTISVAGNQKYSPAEVNVEGDYSNAAFLDAFNIIGGDVKVTGLSEKSVQGDRAYVSLFKNLLVGFSTIDISDIPDLAPILMSVAAAMHGARLTGTRRLKIKESDRGAAMAEELSKFGVRVDVSDDEITVFGGMLKTPEKELSSHNDHRIAMSLSVLSSLTGGTISGAEAVRKSYPDFFETIKKLGIEVKEIGNTEE